MCAAGCPLIGSLADAFAYASAAGVTLRIDGTEVQVRRPRANKLAAGRSPLARRR
jgi:hypothetical protein